jgi:hypothetical protein
MKSSTAVGTASTMEAASTAMGSTPTMAAATLSERRRGRSKKHERNNRNEYCGRNENYRQDLLHFSPSNPTTRDCRTGTNFRRGHLRWQPTYRPILHPRRASSQTPPNATRLRRPKIVGLAFKS